MGDAVNVAARMEQTAEPGTVQITDDTYRLVADLFDVEPLGEVELKGKRRPVRSYRVLARRASPWRVRAARPLEGALVGREPEMGLLRSALRGVQQERGSIVLIVGDPGLGKTRLVEEANALWSEMAPEDDRRWDSWHCVPYDTMQPYAQYRRLIRERAGITQTDPAEVVRGKIAELMRESFRKTDILARYGGEELVGIATVTSLEGATVLADRFREMVFKHPFTADNQQESFTVTISLGVTSLDGMSQGDELLIRADKAMYEAKAKGGNKVCVAV